MKVIRIEPGRVLPGGALREKRHPQEAGGARLHHVALAAVGHSLRISKA